ncbi:hypothetical protein THAOC_28500 [Thalassiosira oceanica]|uniref:Uncharacterized protein n=1 Tax=Thalassiosira oceanica TaxID=159749 RepID=K0RTP6_THAOC|nr:hypothetical protein THAOC_28500 [Thalassiosira oceanica]|eukprot:EJK52251.1 hypothetical protein THAOC_28500 [Thalassiosira oceanica]
MRWLLLDPGSCSACLNSDIPGSSGTAQIDASQGKEGDDEAMVMDDSFIMALEHTASLQQAGGVSASTG